MKLYEVLGVYEARKNPAQNPKLSPIEQLRKYKDDPDIFISFKSVPFVHINPAYPFNTPAGVYFYPLKVFWEMHTSDFEAGKFPSKFATNLRYIHVIKYNGKGERIVRRPVEYTKTDLEHDLKMLDRLGYDVEGMMSKLPNNQYTTTPFGQFWNTLNVLTTHVTGNTSNGANKQSLAKNKILRQLGYAYICEREYGSGGVIHPNEPAQGFFTSGAYLKTIDQIDTVRSTDSSRDLMQELLKREKIQAEAKELLQQAMARGTRLSAEEESIISKDSNSAYLYALNIIKGRFEKAELYIKKVPYDAYYYAADVIKGRFEKAEPFIMKYPDIAFLYARDIIKGRWPKAEPAIMSDLDTRSEYEQTFGLK
jgi:hypothetical protein